MGKTSHIRFVRDGEAVNAGVTNRPSQQINQNLEYLYSLVEAASIGSSIYARNQTVVSTIVVGQPVYYNSANSRFEAAFAAVATDPSTGYLVTAESSHVWGIVASKSTATAADILLFGFVDLDITEAVDTLDEYGNVPSGLWYLSGQGEGILTQAQPPVSVPVLRTVGTKVYVNPRLVDFLENHRHYVFSLTMLPAGTVVPPSPGDVHSISAADSGLPGWLPADDAIFDSTAPAGAKFGYNLSQDTSLKNCWPPLPLESVSLEMHRPSSWDITAERRVYGQTLSSDTVIVDNNGIWWMTDCYDAVPWPTDYDSESSASDSYSDCDPAGKEYALKLYFTKVNFATDLSAVSSLQSSDDRLKVVCTETGLPAVSGNLSLSLALEFLLSGENASGYLAIKTFDPETGTFSRGPLAESIYTTSPNVLLSGEKQTTSGGITYHQGKVRVNFASQPTLEIPGQLVRLDGATEESYPVLYLGMSGDYASSYVVQFSIPFDASDGSEFKLRLRLLGRVTGSLPQLTVEYYISSRPEDGLTTPIAVTQSYSALTITTVASVTANTAVEAESEAIEVAPGDILHIRVSRDPDDVGDAYSGELGIMQQVGILSLP